MARQKITKEQIEKAYELAKKVYDEGLSKFRAAEELHEKYLMNENSAFMYLNAIQYMMEGKEFKAGINPRAAEYFLDNILNDYGKKSLVKALNTLSHYRESNNEAQREIFNKFQKKVEEKNSQHENTFSQYESILKNNLEYSLKNTPKNVVDEVLKKFKEEPKEVENALKKVDSKKNRESVTEDRVKKIYELGKKVYDKRLVRSEAVQELVKYPMKKGTAEAYLTAFQAMIYGKLYTGSVNEYATEYFLDNIFNDYGKERLEKAVNSLSEHIEHYKSRPGIISEGKLEILERFRGKIKDVP